MLKAFGYIFNTHRVPDIEKPDFKNTLSGSEYGSFEKAYKFEILQLVVP
jgi:hypothetical protein